MKSKEYWELIIKMREEVLDLINEKIGKRKKVKIGDVYLGERKEYLSGYPKVLSLYRKDGEIIAFTTDEDVEISNYNLEELLCLLEKLEK